MREIFALISLKSSEAYVRSTGGHAVQCFLLARGLCLQHFALPAVFALCCLTTAGALHPSSLHAITALRTTPTLPPPSTPTTLLFPFFFNSTNAKTQSLLNGLALLSLAFDAPFILHSRRCCLSLQSNTENRSHALCLYYKCAAEV